MIHELLAEGRTNARTAKELSAILNCRTRDVTQQIERERREGVPICAACGENPGYYLPADVDELAKYCAQLKGRAIEVFKTRQALVTVLKQLQEKKQQELDAEHG